MRTEVKNALDKLEGVEMIKVDVGRVSIEVGYNKALDESKIKQCIENIGCKIE